MAFWMRIVLVCFVLWFIPWVFCFYLGFVVYFPYEPDGGSRYVRITGPLIGLLEDNRWIDGKDIPKACTQAVVAAEDDRFYEHYGIDIERMEQALKKNERLGKRHWGASTITQQIVKNVFLSRHRSYLRKAREIAGAVILDAIMSKELQLTWYFNVVEFGPRVYGLHDAAAYYFHKKPQELSRKECVMLVALLPSPNRTGKLLKSQTYSNSLKRRMQHIARTVPFVDDDKTVATE